MNPMHELPDTDRDLLRLAGAQYRYEANRLQAAQDRFGLGDVAFWARVNTLLDEPAAAMAEPQIVARLRRLRDQRSWQRRAS